MDAGRTLDAFVALNVMGWHKHVFGNYPWQLQPPDKPEINGIEQVRLVPYYSTDIAAAWKVVEKMQSDGFGYGISDFPDKTAECSFYHFERELLGTGEGLPPLAICLAALRAIGIMVKEKR